MKRRRTVKRKNDTFALGALDKEAKAKWAEIESKEKFITGEYWDLWQILDKMRPLITHGLWEQHCDSLGIDKNGRKYAKAIGTYPTREEAAAIPLTVAYENAVKKRNAAKDEAKKQEHKRQEAKAAKEQKQRETGTKRAKGVPQMRRKGANAKPDAGGDGPEEAAPEAHTDTPQNVSAKAPPVFTAKQLKHLAAFVDAVGKETAIALLEWLKANEEQKDKAV